PQADSPPNKNEASQNSREEGTETGENPGGAKTPTKGKGAFTDRVLRFLSFLPFWAILAIIARDVSALFMKSPTSGTSDWLGLILLRQVEWGSVFGLWNSAYPIFLIIVFDSFAIACAIYTRRLCNRSRRFGQGSQKALKKFEDALNRDKAANARRHG